MLVFSTFAYLITAVSLTGTKNKSFLYRRKMTDPILLRLPNVEFQRILQFAEKTQIQTFSSGDMVFIALSVVTGLWDAQSAALWSREMELDEVKRESLLPSDRFISPR